MGKLFVGDSETIKVEVYIDYSGRFAKAIVKPDLELLELTGAFANVDEEKKKKTYDLLLKRYEESIKKPSVKKEWFEFKYWSYGLRKIIEKEAEITDPITKDTSLDADLLNENKIKYLLVDWSLQDEKGEKIKLERVPSSKKGVDMLSEKSLAVVLSLESSVIYAVTAELNSKLYMSKEEEKN